MNAWLITWEGTDRGITPTTKLLAILSSRRKSSFIESLAEVFYLRNFGTADDMLYLANRKEKRFYACTKSPSGGFFVGNNPFVYARQVSELKITKDGSISSELVSWKEPPIYRQNEEKGYAIELVDPGAYQSLVRPATVLANDLHSRGA